ncbi:helix-turn-helix domain-containing protein [Micromonospora phytophila]|uniref:winged helix-turn-helix domain-containing protein n=1 Tax=Micromonospora phytophila TaxID=709888 RepID=UPI00202E7476|nr:helix-turn-helix domain-containing protein [Micromonospora phytophila]MCM0674016.1 helix-turn-helix domain-containing protein [Micromonospora phytophila]
MSLPEVKLSDPTALRGYAHPLRMALIGLLRQQGPLTATQAAAQLGESVPSCSFHLRQLAKYGLAERAPGADGRERPWRATALTTHWDDNSDDPEVRAATDELHAVQLALYTRLAEEFLARRAQESTAWRAVTGFSDQPVHVTPDEMAELTRRIDALLGEYDDRITDPTKRPAGSRKVSVMRLAVLAPPPPGSAATDDAATATGGTAAVDSGPAGGGAGGPR